MKSFHQETSSDGLWTGTLLFGHRTIQRKTSITEPVTVFNKSIYGDVQQQQIYDRSWRKLNVRTTGQWSTIRSNTNAQI
jgi:hypothetical protein